MMELRSPDQVMRLANMGAAFPTRLSFMRQLLRRLSAEGAEVTRGTWEIDDQGYGHAVYTVPLGGHPYSLVAFSSALAAENRTDRVIAEAWDTTYVLYDGIPDAAEIARLAKSVPLQEAARYEPSDLILSRANRSVRLFDHVTQELAAGRQPDPSRLSEVGYLMRTTAVYGNGKFGIADRAMIADRPGLAGPFQAEMLTVWLIRGFTHDLADHVAVASGGQAAVQLDPALKRGLGIGNATGLGMAPFLVSHPDLLHNWTNARETALARVRALPDTDADRAKRARALLSRARAHAAGWIVADTRQMDRIRQLRDDLDGLAAQMTPDLLNGPTPWDNLYSLADKLGAEARELTAALLIELHGEIVDDLADTMSSGGAERLDPRMTTATLGQMIACDWGFAQRLDFETPEQTARFWYVSEEKLEPRLGERATEPGAHLEMPLDIARQVQALSRAMPDDPEPLATFLARHPEHRNAARRVQALARAPYAEIRDNLIADTCLPIDMLRFKLAMFGASRFDPKSDRWTRITMYQGAPLAGELADGADDWWLAVPWDAPE